MSMSVLLRTLINIIELILATLVTIVIGLVLVGVVNASVVFVAEKIGILLGVSLHLVLWLLLAAIALFLAIGIILHSRQTRRRRQYLDCKTDVVLRSFEIFDKDDYDEETPGNIARVIEAVTPFNTFFIITAKKRFVESYLSKASLRQIGKDLWVSSLTEIKDSVDEIWRLHPWNYTVNIIIARDDLSCDRILNLITDCNTCWKKGEFLRIGEIVSKEPDLDIIVLSTLAEEHLVMTLIHRRESTLPIAEITRALILDLIPETMQNKAEKRLLA